MSRNEKNVPVTPPTTPPPSTAATKLCHIVKRPDFEGYGFNLHSEKIKPGQYIGKVDANSPAEAAGLKEGDRIIEVNGVAIGSETHKQVVQRIKAIACEVRLLLIDVDGKCDDDVVAAQDNTPSMATSNSKINIIAAKQANGNAAQAVTTECASTDTAYQGTVQEIPGASANISSISMVSTKRMSSSSTQSGASGLDVTDKAANLAAASHNGTKELIVPESNGSDTLRLRQLDMLKQSNVNNNVMAAVTTPPPPSAAIATVPRQQQVPENAVHTATGNISPFPSSNNIKGSSMSSNEGILQLPITAAEMRAKLMSKKKYDPKNESVDLKKKFEIIQKL